MTSQLDRQRAAGIQPQTFTAVTTGNEPLIVDAVIPHTQKKHWIVELVSFVSKLTVNAPSGTGGFPPNTGIYLCPPGTPIETIGDANAGMNATARPVLLPLGPPGANVASIASGSFPFAFAMTSAVGFKFTLPFGWFIRAIVVPLQGAAAPPGPGPGAGSQGILTVMAVQESDDDDAPIFECQ